jgi:hypothetical protein
MTRLAALRRPAATKHLLLQLGVILLIISGASWNYDAWLLLRMKIIANDAFAFGCPSAPTLLMDGSDELRTYSPARVAEFLSCPSAQIRSVAFLSLAERDDDHDPRDWVGVVPRLLQAFACESDSAAKECARSALLNLPLIPIADVPATAAFIESDAPNDDSLRPVRTALISKVLHSDPERLAWMRSVYRLWMESPEVKDRRAAFNELMALAPSASETVAAFKELMKAGDPDRIAASAGRRILHRHPSLIEEFLVGNAAERRFLLECAVSEARAKAHRSPNAHCDVFTEGQLQRLEQLQESSLAADTAKLDEVNKSCEFLRFRPRGEEILLMAAGRLNGRKKETVLHHAQTGQEEQRRR